MLVEVSDTTLRWDRDHKGLLYARNRIPVYWIINLIELQVEVYTQPVGGRVPRYKKREVYGAELGAPVVINGREIAGFPVRRLFS